MPEAPVPTFNGHGRLMLDWNLYVRYDASKDVVTLSWSKEGDTHHSARYGAVAYPPTEVDDLLEGVRATVEVLHRPRLF